MKKLAFLDYHTRLCAILGLAGMSSPRAKSNDQDPALNAATEMLCSICRVAGAAVAKLAYAAGLKSAGDFPVVGSSPTSRTICIYNLGIVVLV